MQDGDPLREARDEALYGLRGERDFRHQNNASSAHFHCFRECPQVYLGLATGGNAVKQENIGVRPLIIYRFADARKCVFLGAGKLRR